MKSIVLPAGTEHVLFGDLAHLIADALWPDAGANDDRMTYACAQIRFDGELARAVKCGALPVKDPLTLGPHTFPIGDALNRAFVSVDDLREFVAGRGLSVSFQFSINEDGGSTTFRATQEEYDAMAAGKQAQRDERHKRGHYSMYEAAEVLAAANSIGGAEAFIKNRMRPAVESGALVLLDPIDGGPVMGRLCRPYDDWVTPKAINEWLAGAEFDYRWPVAGAATQAAPAQSPATPAPVGPDEIDFTMVATRTELIGAFGKFTEMNMTWFDNLTDTPKLKAARKFTGLGGRNSAEPLFCPYEVMQWLADPKRKKKGKTLSVTTAWRLLKNNFPKVYNQYSIGDPNTD